MSNFATGLLEFDTDPGQVTPPSTPAPAPIAVPGRYEGAAVLVTGGGSGIGAAAAIRFADEGARVAIVGRTTSKLDAVVDAYAGPGSISAVTADVSVSEDAARAVRTVVQRYGRLDVLVNNAAHEEYGSVEELTDEAWRAVFATTIDAAFYMIRAAVPHLAEQRGSVVNVGSISAVKAERRHAAYNAAKGALVQLTNAAAMDHGAQFRVNAVHPGFTLGTELTAPAAAYPQIVEAFEGVIPSGRTATTSEVAAAICFLASPDAAGINGAHLSVDGGLSAATAQPDFSSAV